MSMIPVYVQKPNRPDDAFPIGYASATATAEDVADQFNVIDLVNGAIRTIDGQRQWRLVILGDHEPPVEVPTTITGIDSFVNGAFLTGSQTRPATTTLPIGEIVYALNAYNSSVASAQGVVTGQRIDAVKTDKTRLERLLWDHREAISALIRQSEE